MILPVVAYGDPVLRRVAKEIGPDYPNLKELIANMKQTMYNASGVGIAAPQIGKSVRIFIIDATPFAEDKDISELERDQLKDFKEVFINPIIISSHSGTGIEELRTTMLHSLFGPQRFVLLEPGTQEEPAIEALLSRLFDTVYVHEHRRVGDGIEVRISASDETLAILQATYGERIELK